MWVEPASVRSRYQKQFSFIKMSFFSPKTIRPQAGVSKKKVRKKEDQNRLLRATSWNPAGCLKVLTSGSVASYFTRVMQSNRLDRSECPTTRKVVRNRLLELWQENTYGGTSSLYKEPNRKADSEIGE